MMDEAMGTITNYYKDNYDQLVKKLTRRAGSPENAEDVVQEAFTRAMEFRGSYDPSRPFEGWFVTILTNSLRQFKISERNMGMALSELEHVDEVVEEDHNLQLYKEEVGAMIEKLPPEEKEIVRLYFLLGYKVGEIVKILDENYRRVLYARAKFQAQIESKYECIRH